MNAAEALLMGIEREKSAYSFFKSASEVCGDPAGRQMFAQLAEAELGHLRYLESLYSGLISDANWQLSQVEPVPTCPVGIDRPDLQPCAVEEEQKCKTIEDDLEILDRSIGNTEETKAFYQDLTEKLDDSTGKTIFEYLASEEDTHKRILQEARRHLAETGDWHHVAAE